MGSFLLQELPNYSQIKSVYMTAHGDRFSADAEKMMPWMQVPAFILWYLQVLIVRQYPIDGVACTKSALRQSTKTADQV